MTTAITHDGQRYFDDPVFAKPLANIMERSVSAALDKNYRPKPPIVLRHERVALRWMRPGPDGKLIPK